MRDPKRIDRVLSKIKKVWEKHPDLRLMQLLLNIREDMYYVEDDKLMIELEDFYENVISYEDMKPHIMERKALESCDEKDK